MGKASMTFSQRANWKFWSKFESEHNNFLYLKTDELLNNNIMISLDGLSVLNPKKCIQLIE